MTLSTLLLFTFAATPTQLPPGDFTARGGTTSAVTACEAPATRLDSDSAKTVSMSVVVPSALGGQRVRFSFTVDAHAVGTVAPLRPPFAWAAVEMGQPLHRFRDERVRVEQPCQRVSLELDVPAEAGRVTVGLDASGVGFVTISRVEVTALGAAKKVDWLNEPRRGRVGDFWFNDGVIISRQVGFTGELHRQADGNFANGAGDFVKRDAGSGAWLAKLGPREGRFTFSTDGTTHHFEGTWGTRWKPYPTRIDWSATMVRTAWGELKRELLRYDGAQVEEGCHRYSWCGRHEQLLEVCGLDEAVPPAQALAVFLLDGFERGVPCKDPIP
jgi:hypothetical protein